MEASASDTKGDNLTTVVLADGKTERLLKLAVIYGANASGKTNMIRMLMALNMMINRAEVIKGGDTVMLYDPFRLDNHSESDPVKLSISFIVNEVKYIYSIVCTKYDITEEKLVYYPKGVPALVFERERTVDATGMLKYIPKYGSTISKADKGRIIVFPNKLILPSFLFEVPDEILTPVATYLSSLNIANGYNHIMLDRLWTNVKKWIEDSPLHHKMLVELLAFADLGIKEFSTPAEEREIERVTMRHDRRMGDELIEQIDFKFYDESYGTRQLFVLGGKILQSLETGLPLFVDEMDTGFHTYLTSFLVDLYRNRRINKNNAQLIITTHDINLLDERCIRRDQVWFTEKSEDGSSELFSLSDFEGVREDTPFARWYMANKFGGVPRIDSLEKLFTDV